MDFEEQLEKAERLDSPSLVGSSIRSADDSAHNNYIHPEKYKKTPVSYAKLGLNDSISTSLDDLINEGALIGSEEDFDRFLDDKGNVKDNAKFLSNDPEADKPPDQEASAPADTDDLASPEQPSKTDVASAAKAAPAEKPVEEDVAKTASSGAATPAISSFYQQNQQEYSNPNLSEYQLENSIQHHDDLLEKIRQEDPHRKLADFTKENKIFENSNKSGTSEAFRPIPLLETRSSKGPEGFHSPYFQRDIRPDSTSRSRYDRSPSANRSKTSTGSGIKPHLARGDSYKNTHELDPSKYELPGDLGTPDEADDSGRQSRRTRPTMGDSIAAAEAENVAPSLFRGESLVTTGDYTNFNVDSPDISVDSYSKRSASAVNYLRSISRSRSRQPPSHNEKNDANPSELFKEGALINEDPYSTIDGLDTMVEKVLQKRPDEPPKKVTAEKVGTDDGEEEKVEVKEEPVATEEAPSEPLTTEKEATETKDIEKELTKSEATEEEAETPTTVEEETQEEESKSEDDTESKLEVSEEKDEVTDTAIASDGEVKAESEADAKDEENTAAEVQDVDKDEVKESPAKEVKETKAQEEVVQDSAQSEESEVVEPANKETTEVPQDDDPKTSEESREVQFPAKDDDLDLNDISPEEYRAHLESQPVYIYTSLAGGMQIVHKTNRLMTILKANQIEFTARDLGVDDEAKKLWRRYGKGKSLPGVVRGDEFFSNWQDIEDANESYAVKDLIYEY